MANNALKLIQPWIEVHKWSLNGNWLTYLMHTWNPHIQTISTKISGLFRVIKRLNWCLPHSILIPPSIHVKIYFGKFRFRDKEHSSAYDMCICVLVKAEINCVKRNANWYLHIVEIRQVWTDIIYNNSRLTYCGGGGGGGGCWGVIYAVLTHQVQYTQDVIWLIII